MLSLVLFTVSLFSLSAVDTSSANTFSIQGKFIAEHQVHFEVYTINSDSTLELVSVDCAFKFFNIDINVGDSYLIKFVSDEQMVKYLYVDVTEYGGFGIDVDFNRQGSARLVYDPYIARYSVIQLNTADILYAEKGIH